MIERIEIKNFTVFSELELNLSPKINIIIGENGAGKTHLLKAAYGLCAGVPLLKSSPNMTDSELELALTAKFLRLFMPLDDRLGKLHRQSGRGQATLAAEFAGDHTISATFSKRSQSFAIQDRSRYELYSSEAVFIPTKEVLSLVKGMKDEVHDQRTVELIFDDGYIE